MTSSPEDPPSRSAGGLFDNDLAATVRQSAQQIWLAGLGAFAKAQEEGSKMFESLVKEGASVQGRTQPDPAERPAESAVPPRTGAFGSAFGAAAPSWDRLESIFEDRVAKALNRLGVPSLKEVAALNDRLDALAAEVARLSAAAPAPAGGGSPGGTADDLPGAAPGGGTPTA